MNVCVFVFVCLRCMCVFVCGMFVKCLLCVVSVW